MEWELWVGLHGHSVAAPFADTSAGRSPFLAHELCEVSRLLHMVPPHLKRFQNGHGACSGGTPMERVREYLKNAQECRAIAERAVNDVARAHFIQMAETWETLARHRQAILEKDLEPPKDGGGSSP